MFVTNASTLVLEHAASTPSVGSRTTYPCVLVLQDTRAIHTGPADLFQSFVSLIYSNLSYLNIFLNPNIVPFSYSHFSSCWGKALYTDTLWTEQSMQRGWKQPCLFLPTGLSRSSTRVSTRMCFELGVSSYSGLHKLQVPRSLSWHMWPKRTMPSRQS